MEVHQEAEGVIAFWLQEVPPERRFARDAALDALIGERFGALRAGVVRDAAAGWRNSPRPLLAAVILIDQFSRNLFRGSGEAFAADPLARALSREAVAKGWDAAMTPGEHAFLYMPMMHSERMSDQLRSIALFEALGLDIQIRFARLHAAQIARFGRYPQRNEALGRQTTAEEAAFLADPDNHF